MKGPVTKEPKPISDGARVNTEIREVAIGPVHAKLIPTADVSVCIGATFSHFLSCANGLLSWLSLSTIFPSEVIFAVSEGRNWTSADAIFTPDVLRFFTGVRILLLVRDGRFNQAENRNLAAQRSSSNVVMFWDIDDVMHSRRVELINQHFLQRPDSSVLLHRFAKVPIFDATSILTFAVSDLGPQMLEDISYREAQQIYREARSKISFGVLWCCLPLKGKTQIDYHNAWLSVRKFVFMEQQFNESWSVYRAEDSDLTMRLFLEGYNVSLSRLQLGLYSSTDIKKLPRREM